MPTVLSLIFMIRYECIFTNFKSNEIYIYILITKVKPEIDVFQVGKEYMDPL